MMTLSVLEWCIGIYAACLVAGKLRQKIQEHFQWKEFFSAAEDRSAIHRDAEVADEAIRAGKLFQYRAENDLWWGRPHRSGSTIRIGRVRDLTKIDAIRLSKHERETVCSSTKTTAAS